MRRRDLLKSILALPFAPVLGKILPGPIPAAPATDWPQASGSAEYDFFSPLIITCASSWDTSRLSIEDFKMVEAALPGMYRPKSQTNFTGHPVKQG